jgi:simple sugar transport system permease protein
VHGECYLWFSYLFSGLACGAAGALLSIRLGSFVPNMSAGKGWIALVVIYLGLRNPLGVLAGAFFFALAEALSNYAQGALRLPSEAFQAMPYLIALVLYITASGRKKQ